MRLANGLVRTSFQPILVEHNQSSYFSNYENGKYSLSPLPPQIVEAVEADEEVEAIEVSKRSKVNKNDKLLRI